MTQDCKNEKDKVKPCKKLKQIKLQYTNEIRKY